MLRQVGRLRLCTAAAAAAAEGGSAATWAPPSSAALQLVDRWQQGQGGNGGHGGFRAVQQHAGARAFSLWPGKPEEQRAAAEDLSDPAAGSFAASADLGIGSAAASEAAASAAAAAAASPVTSDIFSAAAIVAAAAGAEGDALASAADDTWLGGRLVQRLLTLVHASSGLPWWEDIMLCTLAMRLMTFPVMLGQIKNTYRLSQVRWVPPGALPLGAASWICWPCGGAGQQAKGEREVGQPAARPACVPGRRMTGGRGWHAPPCPCILCSAPGTATLHLHPLVCAPYHRPALRWRH